MERMKHTGDYELDEINMLEQECADLEEENKRLEEENKKLKERVSELEDVSEDYDLLSKDFITLGEENEKLKSDLAYERTMLDNVRAEYKSLQNVIKKLNEKYRKELKNYVYDAKQVRDIC